MTTATIQDMTGRKMTGQAQRNVNALAMIALAGMMLWMVAGVVRLDFMIVARSYAGITAVEIAWLVAVMMMNRDEDGN